MNDIIHEGIPKVKWLSGCLFLLFVCGWRLFVVCLWVAFVCWPASQKAGRLSLRVGGFQPTLPQERRLSLQAGDFQPTLSLGRRLVLQAATS